jgi:hypothetical protein
MSAGSGVLSEIEQEVGTLSAVAGQVMPGQTAKIGQVTTDVQLGVAALPLAISIIEQLVGGLKALFAHHTSAAANPPAAPPGS